LTPPPARATARAVLRALLLDLDGTLVDTPQAIVEVTPATLGELNLPPADAQAIKNGIGLPLPLALGELIGKGPAGAGEAVEIYRRLWRAQVTPSLPHLLYPGVLQGLTTLRAKGLRLAVVTGKAQDGADATVRGAGLSHLVEVTLGYTSVPNPKPAPDLALLALERLGVRAEAAVVVGDASHDLEMARRAGIRSIAVSYGAQPLERLQAASPTWVAHSFAEVVQIALDLASLREP
jgi:phosphoglycolate phosphatase